MRTVNREIVDIIYQIIGLTIVVLFVLFYETIALGSVNINPQEILAESDRGRGNTAGLKWEIHLKTVENNKVQKRKLDLKARDYKSIATFLAPSKVKGRKILMIDRNMWFIKPGLRKPVPISPRQKLMGNASNGDIASTNYSGDYNILSVNDGNFNGEECYIFDLKGKNKKVTYDTIKYWISKKNKLGIRAEFYTISGKMFKIATMEYKNRAKVNGKSRKFISKMTITDTVLKDNITTWSIKKSNLKESVTQHLILTF